MPQHPDLHESPEPMNRIVNERVIVQLVLLLVATALYLDFWPEFQRRRFGAVADVLSPDHPDFLDRAEYHCHNPNHAFERSDPTHCKLVADRLRYCCFYPLYQHD